MLQQQINYWSLKETMRHNRVGESISQQDADTNRINANTNIENAVSNRITANANSRNAESNAINAVSNRIQANAAVMQGQAALRQAGAAERQATVAESYVDSKNWNNYMSPLGGALGQGVSIIGMPFKGTPNLPKPKTFKPGGSVPPKGYKVDADGFWTKAIPGAGLLARAGEVGAVIAGSALGAYALKEVYEYQQINGPIDMIRQR